MRRITVVGTGDRCTPADFELARELGEAIARKAWALITGGRNAGVMAAANEGAKRVEGSLTVGILPGADPTEASPHVDLPIPTDLGSARNNLVILTGEVMIACGAAGAGTCSEIALALKAGRPVVLLAPSPEALELFQLVGGDLVSVTWNVGDAIHRAESLL